MVKRFRSKPDLNQFCEALHPDDGLSYHDLRKKYQIQSKKENYHQEQLARQIHEALEMALLSKCRNSLFEGLLVKSVLFIQASGKFEVTFSSPQTLKELDDVLHVLEECRSLFLESIARNINRKKLPSLSFLVHSHHGG